MRSPTGRSGSGSVGLLAAATLLVAGCGGDSDDSGRAPSTGRPVVEDPGPIHVHGLGLNPGDRALFVATHTGLFRAGEGERQGHPGGQSLPGPVGLTVVGPGVTTAASRTTSRAP
jgi:hypothetical protein